VRSPTHTGLPEKRPREDSPTAPTKRTRLESSREEVSAPTALVQTMPRNNTIIKGASALCLKYAKEWDALRLEFEKIQCQALSAGISQGHCQGPTHTGPSGKRPREDSPTAPTKRTRLESSREEVPAPTEPRPILLVFDLDGVLCERAKDSSAHVFLRATRNFRANGFSARRRPHFDQLLEFLRANSSHFKAMVWSSATVHNVTAVCNAFFQPGFLVDIWGREKCHKYWLKGKERAEALRNSGGRKGIAGVHYELTLKDLKRIWESSKGQWDARNTLLIDDCMVKASTHPLNAIHPRPYTAELCATQEEYDSDDELLWLIRYLEGCRGVPDIRNHVRSVLYTNPAKGNGAPTTPAPAPVCDLENPANDSGRRHGQSTVARAPGQRLC
jgi:hypothetical protein